MIDIFPIIHGAVFLLYTGFSIFTAHSYSKQDKLKVPYAYLFIYIYYTILAIYLFTLVLRNQEFFVKIFQSLIYASASGIIYLFYVRNSAAPEKKDQVDEFGF
jgi:hypothetical protein